MPRLSIHPVPKKRFHGGRWRIYWKWDRQQFSIATPYVEPSKPAIVDPDLRKISAALTEDEPNFPDKYTDDPAVMRYLALRYPAAPATEIPDSDTILAAYDAQISAECGKEWAQNSRVRLRSLAAVGGGILNVTPAIANKYLADILIAGKTPATRNRALNVFTRFFKEAVRVGYMAENPFMGIKLLKEPREGGIVYCT